MVDEVVCGCILLKNACKPCLTDIRPRVFKAELPQRHCHHLLSCFSPPFLHFPATVFRWFNLLETVLQFAATACTIVSGAIAERAKFEAYILYSFFMAAWVIPSAPIADRTMVVACGCIMRPFTLHRLHPSSAMLVRPAKASYGPDGSW